MPTRKQAMFTLLTLSLMALIFWFSSAGHDVSSGQSTGVLRIIQSATTLTPSETLVRKLAHFTLYFTLGALLVVTLYSYRQPHRRAALLAVGIAALYAASDELHQHFIAGRSGQLSDVLLDTIAASIGIGILTLALARNKSCNNS